MKADRYSNFIQFFPKNTINHYYHINYPQLCELTHFWLGDRLLVTLIIGNAHDGDRKAFNLWT